MRWSHSWARSLIFFFFFCHQNGKTRNDARVIRNELSDLDLSRTLPGREIRAGGPGFWKPRGWPCGPTSLFVFLSERPVSIWPEPPVKVTTGAALSLRVCLARRHLEEKGAEEWSQYGTGSYYGDKMFFWAAWNEHNLREFLQQRVNS